MEFAKSVVSFNIPHDVNEPYYKIINDVSEISHVPLDACHKSGKQYNDKTIYPCASDIDKGNIVQYKRSEPHRFGRGLFGRDTKMIKQVYLDAVGQEKIYYDRQPRLTVTRLDVMNELQEQYMTAQLNRSENKYAPPNTHCVR